MCILNRSKDYSYQDCCTNLSILGPSLVIRSHLWQYKLYPSVRFCFSSSIRPSQWCMEKISFFFSFWFRLPLLTPSPLILALIHLLNCLIHPFLFSLSWIFSFKAFRPIHHTYHQEHFSLRSPLQTPLIYLSAFPSFAFIILLFEFRPVVAVSAFRCTLNSSFWNFC